MNKIQLSIVWIVGLLESGILFYVGIAGPREVNANYDRRKMELLPKIEQLTKSLANPSPTQNVGAVSALADQLGKMVGEIDKQEREDPEARESYIVGAVLPVLIVGACLFVTAQKIGITRNDRGRAGDQQSAGGLPPSGLTTG